MQKTTLCIHIPAKVWQQDWVIHCKPVGDGRTALKYLAPYIFRVAISNRRLVKLENDQVTFRYRTSDTGQLRLCILSAEEFIHSFLQHVLPIQRPAGWRGLTRVASAALQSIEPAGRFVLIDSDMSRYHAGANSRDRRFIGVSNVDCMVL